MRPTRPLCLKPSMPHASDASCSLVPCLVWQGLESRDAAAAYLQQLGTRAPGQADPDLVPEVAVLVSPLRLPYFPFTAFALLPH